MKKIILGSLLALGVAATPVLVTKADTIPDPPPCVIQADPTLHYDTIGFDCAPYTNPVTGEQYNAFYIGVPHP